MKPATNTAFVGKVLEAFESVDSTDSVAARLLQRSKDRPIEGAVILADFQTAGRGQIGSQWESPAGQNLLASFVFYPKFLSAEQRWALSEAVALAVSDVVLSYFPEKTAIKWPNDVLIDGRKTAGILIRNALSGSSVASSSVGIGLNVNQFFWGGEMSRRPTSLALESGGPIDRQAVFEALCAALETRYLKLKNALGSPVQHGEYLARLWLFEKKTAFESASGERFEGRTVGVDPRTGHLEIERADGSLERFEAKAVRFLE